ncbi:carboxylesterase/lipase family protein [Novosphingobium sediminicola]|uniref:Carboxylic ester hydrolase n=1 Tax=Novosphingobium sediminicola TaxID=563162 RepID=A0A7W6G7V6_9SPHN|nr:carboxylesterase family protein [Novosphingobium sediminicola]MBB3956711.1 para-nitrobenzyl esterase [Novosphingobium sediminicola]
MKGNAFAASMIAIALGTGALQAADRSMQPIPSDPVETSSGRVAGTALASGVKAYLGVPFAAPPTGDLRWAPPKPSHWTGIFNADRKGPACIQVLRPHDINHYFGEEATGEDCLSLNLWTNAKAGEKRPVVVFLYGGGFTIGSSGMANYDGEAMAKAGAVFVNFNYRVGALGFLAHPELTKEQGGASGNYGLMDQTLALQWVRDNIAKFGGDPDKVVIMGQSAGAGSVAAQVLAPAARGLFRAAVMSSGCNLRGAKPTLADAEKIGLAFQEKMGAKSLSEMRAMAADRILATQSESQLGLSVSGVRINGPIVDGRVLPQQAADAVAGGNYARVPMIASFNEDDMAFGFEALTGARTVADYQAGAQKLFGADAAAFLKLYPAKTDADVRSAARRAAQDANLAASARACAVDTAAQGVNVFIDEYARRHPYIPGVKLADQDTATVGAYHTADIPYWFGTQDAYNSIRPTRQWTEWDRTLSKQMMEALLALANTGSPDTPAMPWKAWSAKNDTLVWFGDKVETVKLNVAGQTWLAAHKPAASAQPPRLSRPRD